MRSSREAFEMIIRSKRHFLEELKNTESTELIKEYEAKIVETRSSFLVCSRIS